jgi:hypothetical protein
MISPEAKLTVGWLDEELISGDGRNRSAYMLFTYERDVADMGRVRIYENLRLVEDNIADNLFQWVQPPNSRGTHQRIFDPLPARDTWINTTYAQLDYRGIPHLNFINKVKYEVYNQREEHSDLRGVSSFFGLINKADYTFEIGQIEIEPRIKSEFLHQRPFSKRDPKRRELTAAPHPH